VCSSDLLEVSSRQAVSVSPPNVSAVSVAVSAGGIHSTERDVADVVAFGGIPDPASVDRRASQRIQGQHDADDLQMGRAMRNAKLRDIEASTGMTVNTNFYVLHFSEDDIISKANRLGISLGSNDREVLSSVNALLDLEVDRTMEVMRNIAAVKPMVETELQELGVHDLEGLCEDLIPTGDLGVAEVDAHEYAAPNHPHFASSEYLSHADKEVTLEKPKQKWSRKIYVESAVRRSTRTKYKKKFHDER